MRDGGGGVTRGQPAIENRGVAAQGIGVVVRNELEERVPIRSPRADRRRRRAQDGVPTMRAFGERAAIIGTGPFVDVKMREP